MKLGVVSFLVLGAWAVVRSGTSAASEKAASGPPAAPVPVLVELFTSEGCSSCPPADEVLARLAKTQPVTGALVIALSEHVDYWNHLGWADPYSSHLFSERQGAYAAALGSGVYTPQVVVDGRLELLGSDLGGVRRAVASAAREPGLGVAVSRGSHPSTIRVRIEPPHAPTPGPPAEVLLAIVENDLHSQVSRGENSGRRLSHTAVVRRLESLGVLPRGAAFDRESAVALDPAWKAENLSAVVFVQQGPGGKVLGAGRGAL